ncbi:MAG: glycosyltransferase family 2 protein [Methanolobus sp.]
MSVNMYILVTPAKNEEIDLPAVADSVASQTIKPLKWVIVDDGSTDNTPAIIKDLELKYKWIQSIRLPPRGRDITYHYAYVCKQGFDHIVQECEEEGLEYDYIGLIDADTILEPEFYQKLINELKNNTDLGVISGGVYQSINGKLERRKTSERLPSGTGRLWTKKCFFDTGGYTVEPAPDSISNVKAISQGWKIWQFKDVVAVQTRLTSSAEGLWKGYKANGFMAYYLNKHPLLVFLNALHVSRKKPYYLGIAYSYGYIQSVIKREKKTEDEVVRNYYWNQRLQEYKTMLTKKLKRRS